MIDIIERNKESELADTLKKMDTGDKLKISVKGRLGGNAGDTIFSGILDSELSGEGAVTLRAARIGEGASPDYTTASFNYAEIKKVEREVGEEYQTLYQNN